MLTKRSETSIRSADRPTIEDFTWSLSAKPSRTRCIEPVDISAPSLVTSVPTTASFLISIRAPETSGEILGREAIAFRFSAPWLFTISIRSVSMRTVGNFNIGSDTEATSTARVRAMSCGRNGHSLRLAASAPRTRSSTSLHINEKISAASFFSCSPKSAAAS